MRKILIPIAGTLCATLLCAADAPSVAVSSANMYKVNATTDVLGRHNSKVANTPTVYLANRNLHPVLAREASTNPRITATYGRYENYKKNGSYVENYWLNGSRLNVADYLRSVSFADRRFASEVNTQMGGGNADYNGSLYYQVSTKPSAFYGQDMFITAAQDTFFNINTLIRDNNFYYNGIAKKEYGQGIGIYFAEFAAPANDDNTFVRLNYCDDAVYSLVSNINHANRVARTISHLAKDATIYTIDKRCELANGTSFPERPDLMSPTPIYIGSHSYGNGRESGYSDEQKYVDDYVYNNRVIEFASAGNFASKKNGTSNNVSGTARSLNVIAVGAALRNKSGQTLSNVSSIRNPTLDKTSTNTGLEYDKPEIVNYSNLFFNKDPKHVYTAQTLNAVKTQEFDPIFENTSSATPFTAGMVAVLLHQRQFYKWHPEVVKPLLLTASTKMLTSSEQQENDIADNHNKHIGLGIPNYSAMMQGNRSRYWVGNNDDFFVTESYKYEGNEQTKECITFTEGDITKGKTYRIAISWLSSGSSVVAKHKIPQDIDLYVSQEGVSKPESSTSSSNSFEFLEFKAKNNKPLTIRIVRYSNNNSDRVMLGYNMYEL